MTEETCTRAYWSGFRRIGVYCRDAAMNGFVMRGVGGSNPSCGTINRVDPCVTKDLSPRAGRFLAAAQIR